MALLDETECSLDPNVILDFHLTGSMIVLERALPRGILVSDFVQAELTESDAVLPQSCEVVALHYEEELCFFDELRRRYSRLGAAELGAIAVAHFRRAVLVSNDGLARSAAEDLRIEMSGSLGVLRSAVSLDAISSARAIQIMEEMILAGPGFLRSW